MVLALTRSWNLFPPAIGFSRALLRPAEFSPNLSTALPLALACSVILPPGWLPIPSNSFEIWQVEDVVIRPSAKSVLSCPGFPCLFCIRSSSPLGFLSKLSPVMVCPWGRISWGQVSLPLAPFLLDFIPGRGLIIAEPFLEWRFVCTQLTVPLRPQHLTLTLHLGLTKYDSLGSVERLQNVHVVN